MAEQVIVRIRSTITDLVEAERFKLGVRNGYFIDNSGDKRPEGEIGDACSDVFEYTAVGEISKASDNKIRIKYTEPEGIGYDGCVTTIIVSSDKKETVTLMRTGDILTACLFDAKEKRQLCSYETPLIPFEFFVQTNKVHHTIDMEGGAILLDYFVEVRNINTERIKMFIEIRRR